MWSEPHAFESWGVAADGPDADAGRERTLAEAEELSEWGRPGER